MGIPKKLLLALGASFALMLPVFAPAAYAADVTSTVTIVATCGLTTSTGSISYGSLGQGATSTEQLLAVTNTGSTLATVTLAGTNWEMIVTPFSALMSVSQTHQGTPSTGWAAKTPVFLAPSPYATLGPGTSLTKAFQLAVSLSSPTFTGGLEQTLTFASTC